MQLGKESKLAELTDQEDMLNLRSVSRMEITLPMMWSDMNCLIVYRENSEMRSISV